MVALTGIKGRLQHQLQLLAPARCKVVVREPRNRQHSAWEGGSIVAGLSSFKDMWITKAMYEETGTGVITRYCTG